MALPTASAAADIAAVIEGAATRLGITLPEPIGSFVAALAAGHRAGQPAPDDWLSALADGIVSLIPERSAARISEFVIDDQRTNVPDAPAAPAPASAPSAPTTNVAIADDSLEVFADHVSDRGIHVLGVDPLDHSVIVVDPDSGSPRVVHPGDAWSAELFSRPAPLEDVRPGGV